MAYPFVSGWDYVRAESAHAELLRAGRFCTVIPTAVPPAWSLTKFRLAHYEQGQCGSCFPAGTHVRMADGSERKIEAVLVGDKVLTASGNIGTVRQIHVRHFQGSLINLRVFGHTHLASTPNHPFVTRRGWIAAEDLSPGDWVAMPRYAPQDIEAIQTVDHVPDPDNLQERKRLINPLPRSIALTPGVGRIFGFYLAEGSTDSREINWDFGAHEKKELTFELVDLLKDEWGIQARVTSREMGVTQVTIPGWPWVVLFQSLFGRTAGNKRIHPDLMGGPRDFLHSMISAWLSADGAIVPRTRQWVGTSISAELAIAMFDIANFLGARPSINCEKEQVNEYAASRQSPWKIRLNPDSDSYRVCLEDDATWRRIQGVLRIPHDGSVYNLGVEGDNSYVAEGVGVHNCWLHAAKQCVEVSAAALGYDAFSVCRHFLGWKGKSFEGGGSPCNGGSVADALSAAMADRGGGLPHESLDPYTADSRQLASQPQAAVIEDAKKSHLVAHVDVKSDDDARTLIAQGRPVANGIWWPYGWDDGRTFMDTIGPGTYGHALLEIGYAQPGVFDDHAWFQLDNWHGLLYPPLPADKAAKVQGYKPIQSDKTSDFWVRSDLYEAVRNKGYAERLSATDLDGIIRKVVSVPSFLDDADWGLL